MLVRMRKEMGAEEPTVTPEIDTLILIDRYPLLLPWFLFFFRFLFFFFFLYQILILRKSLKLRKDVDMVTPCCTQLTYEGLIDEVFQIQNSTLD